MRMCELSFTDAGGKVKVCAVEKEVIELAMREQEGGDPANLRVGSIDVIRYLKVTTFTIVLGGRDEPCFNLRIPTVPYYPNVYLM